MKKLTIDFVREQFQNRGYTLVSTEYKNNRTDLEYICPIHNDTIQKIRYDNFQAGKGCKYCGITKSAIAKMIPYSELQKRFNDRNYTLLTTEQERNINHTQKLLYICNIHPDVTQSIDLKSFNQGHGCRFCRSSKGEKVISDWLNAHNFYYIPQKTFDDLIDVRKLSYDFYIPKYNLLIEYQGEFHDGNNRIQTEEKLLKQQGHDAMKAQYAKEHNIQLLTIWYYNDITKCLENAMY